MEFGDIQRSLAAVNNMQNIRPAHIQNAIDGRANEFYKQLVRMIREFDATLDQQHEVGVRLISFGQNITFHLSGLGYSDPFLIRFWGNTKNGEPVELIQHVSQINILLLRLPRKDPSKPKQRIGFHQHEDDEGNK
ncbi:MAG: DUF6173 family protein [Victivallales bacterium]|jgi:hypothetical protein